MKSAVEYLSVFPSIFIKLGRKFSFRNPMFSYLNAPLGGFSTVDIVLAFHFKPTALGFEVSFYVSKPLPLCWH